MNFNSLQYFFFLPCAIIAYFTFPHRWRNGLLLCFSYFFYMCWEARYALLMLTSTLITYVFALLMDKNLWGHRRLWLASSFLTNLAILIFFKYFNFFSGALSNVFVKAGLNIDLPVLNILLPVGISFYTFQALGYTMDVYRSNIKPERNFIDYALFVSFFPQLVAGPIERSVNLLPQLKAVHKFDCRNLFDGLLFFLWGLFKKIVIADNLAVIVNQTFDAPDGSFTGIQYAISAVAFTMQIYCDFSAYSDIARGTARMLGIRLMRNFDAPFYAVSIKDFWRRWHISLSTWFKDYLYFPLGGSRRGKVRVCLNLMVVFLVSGLWHGAAFTFVVWGLLHGFFQVFSYITKPFRTWVLSKLHISDENIILCAFRRVFTFFLVVTAFIFFRAQSIMQAFYIIKSFLSIKASDILHPGISLFSLGKAQMLVVFCAIVISFITEVAISTKKTAIKLHPVARYAVYFILIAATLIFGYYGNGYDPQEFIYFQF